METSVFIAEILGLAWVIVGIGMFLNTKHIHGVIKEFWKREALVYFGGIFSLVIGLLMVLSHNVWEGQPWQIIVSVVGWAALVKGYFLMFSPDSLKSLSKKFHTEKNLNIASVVIVALGIYLLNSVGFVSWF